MSLPRGSGLLRTRAGRLRLGWRLLLFLVVALAVTVAAALVLPATIPGQGGALLVGSLAGGWATLALDGRPPGALGLRLRRAAVREAGAGVALGAGVAITAVAGIALAGGIRWSAESGSVGGYLVAGASALAFFLLPAAGEEALFRGYPLQALAEAMGTGPALVFTSVVFGVVHLQNPGAHWIGALNVTAAGLFLGGLVLRTGSLWWASGAHLGWNWAHGFVADLPVSGLDLVDAPGVAGRPVGPAWLSGGSFGPEGSVVTTGVALAAAAWVWWTPRLAAVDEGTEGVVRRTEGGGGETHTKPVVRDG